MAKLSRKQPSNVAEWVDYIQTLHVREIDLSLDRVRQVFQRLQPNGVSFSVITVAGTNGKGSVCELLTSIYDAAGYATGKYTSPHLQSFNERFSLSRNNVSDQELLAAFIKVEQAREEVRLTFFEFGTLVAIELFAAQSVDVAIMEVGLGGRLDAVNILDADVSIISSISVDHTDWLGTSLDQIALEKIGVTRAHHPCVIGRLEPIDTVLNYCNENKVPSYVLGSDFHLRENASEERWAWNDDSLSLEDLPIPFSQSGVQLENAAIAIKAVQLMQDKLPVSDHFIADGISNAQLLARCQIVSKTPLVVIDVGHNQASIARLVKFIQSQNVVGNIYALCGMLKDKQIKQSLSPLLDIVKEWYLVTIAGDRGSSAESLDSILQEYVDAQITNSTQQPQYISHCFDDIELAYRGALQKLNNDDALIVFGSFFIVGDIMSHIQF